MTKPTSRKEKNCLNCGYIVDKEFCSKCGQENLEAKEFFWTFLTYLFTEHFLIVVFFSIFIMLGIAKVAAIIQFSWVNYISLALSLSLFYYLFRAMLYFYGESFLKTILKCFLFSIAFFGTLILLFIFFFIQSFYAV